MLGAAILVSSAMSLGTWRYFSDIFFMVLGGLAGAALPASRRTPDGATRPTLGSLALGGVGLVVGVAVAMLVVEAMSGGFR